MNLRKGAATAEYVVILAMILGIALLLLWKTIGPALVDRIANGFEEKKKPPEEEAVEAGSRLRRGSGWGFGSGGSSGSERISYGSMPIASTDTVQ